MNDYYYIYLILFLIFVALSALFAAAETSLTSLSKLRIKHLVSSGARGAVMIERVMKPQGRFLAAILLMNDLLNIAAASSATIFAVNLFGEALGAVIATIGATVFVLIVGDVIPKTYAQHNAEKVALFLAGIVQLVIWVLYPFVWLLNKIGLGVTRMIAMEDVRRTLVDEDELHTAINVGEAEGVWEEDEAEMLHNALEFVDRPVREVMTPRTDIVWIENGITLRQFLSIFREFPHSRFPVYEGTTDNVTGVLNIKDILLSQSTDDVSLMNLLPNWYGLLSLFLHPNISANCSVK
jgi:CBS domain containing-hemolysin-like protein